MTNELTALVERLRLEDKAWMQDPYASEMFEAGKHAGKQSAADELGAVIAKMCSVARRGCETTMFNMDKCIHAEWVGGEFRHGDFPSEVA